MSNGNSVVWRSKADIEWGRLIHALYDQCLMHDMGKCCGPLEAHHLIHRRDALHRHDPLNGIILCQHHHQHNLLAPHVRPKAFKEVVLKLRHPALYRWYMNERNLHGATSTYQETYGKLRFLNAVARSGSSKLILLAMMNYVNTLVDLNPTTENTCCATKRVEV